MVIYSDGALVWSEGNHAEWLVEVGLEAGRALAARDEVGLAAEMVETLRAVVVDAFLVVIVVAL
jgi:hypothetical protein